jgi:peroxiredoxin
MKNIVWSLLIPAMLFSCKDKETEKAFEVKGKITNNSATSIYLEELPMATMQARIVDSALIDKDGKFTLEAGPGESSVYNLRLDKSQYPFAAVINDGRKVEVNVTFSKDNKEFPEKYEISGSDASQQMKDFMFAFNSQLQAIYMNDRRLDSLTRAGASDSLVTALQDERIQVAEKTRGIFDEAIKKSKDPALSMFVLGYYQTTANNPAYQLDALSNEEVKKLVYELAAKYPNHTGVASIRKQLAGSEGTMAPEFSLPDAAGNQVSLSSFRGKYVLVDFWASWCKPCRDENPNVVKAYNRFKDKNFTILGVSLDKPGQKDKWLKAIKDDNLTWNHVSDLMEWNSPVVSLYKIEGIPHNVLLDPTGKIIAEKLYGSSLEEKLAEVLK